MLQLRPLQQSPLTVQVAFSGWHSDGASHLPPLQIPEQQVPLVLQVAPLARQLPSASWQVWLSSPVAKQLPEQQPELPPSLTGVQALPKEVQVDTVHRRTPASSGTQGALLQH